MLSERVRRALVRARGTPVHLSLTAGDWRTLGVGVGVTLKFAPRAKRSVLWTRIGDKLVPHELED